ncbi:MAG: hypothetical protein HW405_269, partial [Candidatus Berkelbacteria bacterium]|nr:hypothetical protein [Candidatus Berkelbacteria bacterium]
WLLCRLLGASKIGRYAVYGVLILLLGIISFTSLKMPLVNFVDLAVFSPKNPFFYTNFVLILIITTVISSVSYCWLKFTNKDLPDLEITQPNLFAAIILFIIFVLVLPYGQNTTKQLASNQNGGIFEARYWENIGDIQRIGGRKTIDFVSTLRSNNVFITSNVTVAQNVLLYTPSYAAEYPFGISEFTTSVKLYDPNISLDERITILKTGDINYIITLRPYETDLFANETTVFKKVFANDYTYKIQSQNTAYDKQGEFTVFEFLP